MKVPTPRTSKTSGFSLVEMIIYMAVLILVAVMSVGALLGLQEVLAQYQAQKLVQRSATTALERILYEVRMADSVTSASYAADGSLTLENAGVPVLFATSSRALHITVDGEDLGALTDDRVTVDTLRFYNYDDVSEIVRVELTLTGTIGDQSVTRTFNAGTVLRNAYE
ncbi:type II secretion system GspH family protein [Candidatus Pacebacteria bacterium]|nr:type II secretion system GspH family protein [Candidatus Paceibacterota bacterium]